MKRLPTETKRKKGTLQPCRTNPDEPKPEIVKPKAPDFIYSDSIALKEWDRVVDEMYTIGTISNCDVAILALYCTTYSRLQVALKEIKSEITEENQTGLLIVSPNGYFQPNPFVSIAKEAGRDLCKYAAELGLTPASRSKVSAINKPKESGWV